MPYRFGDITVLLPYQNCAGAAVTTQSHYLRAMAYIFSERSHNENTQTSLLIPSEGVEPPIGLEPMSLAWEASVTPT